MTTIEKLQKRSAIEFKTKVIQLIDKTSEEIGELYQTPPDTEFCDEHPTAQGNKYVTVGTNEPANYEAHVRQPFLTQLQTNLMERFPKIDVLEEFSVLDPAGLLE